MGGGQDMKLKTLLLGSAAAFAVVGGAQAADLSVAEPVDYVRVCDAMGVGFWYIPGTDTCLKIGGYVEFTVNIHETADVWAGSGTHSAAWDFATEAGVSFTAKSMTEYGILTGFVEFRGKSNNNDLTNSAEAYYDLSMGHPRLAYLDSAWLSLGPLLAGRTTSTFDYGGGFSDQAYRSDSGTDQIRLTWAMSGFGLMLGVEDPRDRWGTELDNPYSMPDIIAAITAAQGNWDGKLSAGFANAYDVNNAAYGLLWGVNAGITVKLDAIAPGDQFRINAAVGTGQSFVGGGTNGYTNWSAFASFKHFWSPTMSSALTGSYRSDGGTYGAGWAAGGNLVWAPVAGFSAGAELLYYNNNGAGSLFGKVRFKRSW
jgi:hypothetical protein